MITKKEDWQQLNTKKNGSDSGKAFTPNDDEIDLMDLLVRMIYFMKRYKIWLSSAAAFGFFVSLLYFFTVKPLFKSEFVFDVSVLEKNELEHLIKQLSNHIAEHNTAVMNTFNIDPYLVEEIGLKESDKEVTSHTVFATVTDPAYLPELQHALVSYISNNDFTKHELASEESIMLRTLETLRSEQLKVAQVLNNITAGKAVGSNEFVDIADIFQLKIEIEREKILLENKLKNLKSVTVIQDFPQYSQSYNRNFFIITGIGVAGMFGLMLLICGGRELFRMASRHRYQVGVVRFSNKY